MSSEDFSEDDEELLLLEDRVLTLSSLDLFLAEFLTDIGFGPWLACVCSCRSEGLIVTFSRGVGGVKV